MKFSTIVSPSVIRCEAVRLYTGTSAQIFSVRLRDKGPDYRGFVQVPLLPQLPWNYLPMQLPTVEGLGLGESLEGEAAVLVHSAAQCCVDSCVRNQVGDLENSIQIPTALLILVSIREVGRVWKGLVLTQLHALLQG